MWDKRWQRFTMWVYCIRESMDIQLSADVFSSSRRKIYLSRSGSIGLPWWWRLVKNIIINKSLIMRSMKLWMLIWKVGSSRDAARHSERHLKTELESLHWMSGGKKRPPMAMLQASDWPTKWGHLGMRILIGQCHINRWRIPGVGGGVGGL